jgi:hypothetical protein
MHAFYGFDTAAVRLSNPTPLKPAEKPLSLALTSSEC